MNAPMTRLADHCILITKGTTPTSVGFEFTDAGIPFLRVQNIENGNVEFDRDTLFIDEKTNGALRRSQIKGGDILVSIAGTIGRAAIVPDYAPSLNCNQAVAIVRTNGTIHRPFLRYWLESNEAKRQMRGATVTGTISNLSLSELGGLRLSVPAVSEQWRIADILDKADALRAKRRAALAQLDTLTQSIFLEMFGDPAAKGWRITAISEVAADHDGSIRTGPFGSQLLHSEFIDDGPVAVLGIDNVVENEFRWASPRFVTETKYRQLKRYTVQAGDVLITIMGTCGRCAIVPPGIRPAINTKHLCCITLDRTKCIPEFLRAYFLQHPIARKYLDQKAKGAIMEGLNMGIIKEMPIPFAPMELQDRFAKQLASLNALKAKHRFCLGELDALFGSLQHRAFRGELTPDKASQAA